MPLPATSRNGRIVRYTVYYRKAVRKTDQLSVVTLLKSHTDVHGLVADIGGLSIYTQYVVSVSASTSAGEGRLSRGVVVSTDEAGELPPSPLHPGWPCVSIATFQGKIQVFELESEFDREGDI